MLNTIPRAGLHGPALQRGTGKTKLKALMRIVSTLLFSVLAAPVSLTAQNQIRDSVTE